MCGYDGTLGIGCGYHEAITPVMEPKNESIIVLKTNIEPLNHIHSQDLG